MLIVAVPPIVYKVPNKTTLRYDQTLAKQSNSQGKIRELVMPQIIMKLLNIIC